MKNYRDVVVATFVGLLVAAVPAQAQTTWNLGNFSGNTTVPTGGCAFTNAGGSNGQGNVTSCSANGSNSTSLTVTAFAFNGSSTSSTANKGTVMSWGSYGIGVCNTNEYSDCNNPNHATDNVGTFSDFVMLQFNKTTILNKVSFGWTNGDADFTVLRWTGAGAPTVNGASISSMLAANNWSVLGSFNGAAAGQYDLGNTTLSSSYWLVAAYNTGLNTKSGLDGGDDAFKINSVIGTQSVVPEPSTYALVTAGLVCLFAVARRRRA